MFDVIVVGGRCAGSAVAMLLARRGWQVLLVDKVRFPSDAVSTHYVHVPGAARLRAWGLLDQVLASGCEPIRQISYGVDGIYINGMSPPYEEQEWAIAPRRTSLDHILVEAAAAAGAHVRTGFTVDELLTDDGRVVGIRGHDRDRRFYTETAKIVVGADGVHSIVAKSVKPAEYATTPAHTAVWYSYRVETGINRLIISRRAGCEVFAVPTNNGLVNVLVGVKTERFHEFRVDIEAHYHAVLDRFPELVEQVRCGRRVERFYGTRHTAQWLRRPYGPGWALIGDAGWHKDPIAGTGITDAFTQAEILAQAIDTALAGTQNFASALADYHTWRDQGAVPLQEHITSLATLDQPSRTYLAIITALQHDRDQAASFLGLIGGQTNPKDFFTPGNIRKILDTTKERQLKKGHQRIPR